MPQIPTYPPLKGPLVSRPEKLLPLSKPVSALIRKVTLAPDFWVQDPDEEEKRPVFTVAMAAPVNDRFLVMLSVDNDEQADDPHTVELAERVIKKVEESFPELVDWMDWTFNVG